ncbi:MAG: glycine betaine ABC transporter substrate-binding protein [Acetobacteraceae bacterium]|nr:glycine betaine ABC transporter substrate-binding protein [Acetobacteraceae bacterium]
MPPMTRRTALVAAAAITFASRARAAPPVKVGSKLDTEAALLGTVILLRLKAGSIPTESRLRLGPTKILRSAILSGEVDLYPEYTGNGAFFFNRESDPAWQNAQQGYDLVRKLDAEANHLVWLPPAPANNTWGIAVNGAFAEKHQLKTMEDFAREARAGGIKLAASAEFVASPAALPAFQSAYDFKLSADQMVVLAGGDTAATERAAAEGTSGVNAGMAYGTDGAIAALDLRLMEDTKHAQMVYAPSPVLRQATLDAYPAIPGLLAPAFSALDDETLRTLNAKIAVDGQDVTAVATSWLKEKGLLT